MGNKNIQLSSQAIALSETQTYIELTNRLCYYGDKNYNNFMLPVDGAEDKALTLINQPVVAKYKKINGQDDLGGHEAYYDPIDRELKFNTVSVGTHTEVWIEDDDVRVTDGTTKKLPCLFAKSIIWKRNANIVNAVKRLYEDGALFTSWEIIVNESHTEDGVSVADDYVFIGNALLGSQCEPAYPCAETLMVASKKPSLEESAKRIAEALEQDANTEDNSMSEENKIDSPEVEVDESVAEGDVAEKETTDVEPTATETKEEPVAEAETAEGNEEDQPSEETEPVQNENVENVDENHTEAEEAETSEEENGDQVETSSLTECDLYRMIDKHLWDNIGEGYISFWFPAENRILYHLYGTKELSFVEVYYAVENDVVAITSYDTVELVASPIDFNSMIAERDNAIAEANNTINQLNETIAELTPYKEQVEAENLAKAEAEKASKREEIKAYALDSKLIAEEEIASDETIMSAIEELNFDAIKAIISDRFMASKKKEVEVKETKSFSSVATSTWEETSSKKTTKNAVELFIGA